MNTEIIPAEVLKLLEPIDYLPMYDLGNKKTNGIPYRDFFAKKKIVYDSIDLNGLDGSMPLDLNSELNLPPREMVANIGTSEHVLNQKVCFQNIHNLSSGRMAHWVPMERRHPTRGFFGYSFGFFINLASANKYEIEKLYTELSFKGWYLICCSLKKTVPTAFVWSEDWHLSCNPCGYWGVMHR